MGLWTTATLTSARAQPPANAAIPAEKELEGAAAKVREGKFDEALRLIKEKAGKHPEWPPSQLILARLLFAANQPAAGRRALEQAAAEAPDDPRRLSELRYAGARGRAVERRPAQFR